MIIRRGMCLTLLATQKTRNRKRIEWKSRIVNEIGRNKINSHPFALQIILQSICKFSFRHVLTFNLYKCYCPWVESSMWLSTDYTKRGNFYIMNFKATMRQKGLAKAKVCLTKSSPTCEGS